MECSIVAGKIIGILHGKEAVLNKSMYTLKELSSELEISIRSLREYIKQGALNATKAGRSYLVTPKALDRFVDSGVVISKYGLGKG